MNANKLNPIICIILIFTAVIPISSPPTSAIDLEGESSKVTVRAYVEIHNDGMIFLNFKVLWGISEFKDSDIFRPKAYPPTLPWSELEWNNLTTHITPIDTIQFLFDNPLPDGNKIIQSQEYFVKTVLDLDIPFRLKSIEPRVLSEFETIEIRAKIDPSEDSYTISPLRFLESIDFNGYPPVGELEIETGPSIDIQVSSLALNHFLFPEGHRFKSESLFGLESSRVSYDISEDSIKVRKLPIVISSAILYSLWVGAAILSMIIVSVAARRAQKRTNRGVEMWFGIGVVCFLAFIPYHLFISLLLVILGFFYSLKKSIALKPVPKEKKEESSKDDIPKNESESAGEEGTTPAQQKEPPETDDREDFRSLIPPPLPLSQTTIPKSDPSFAPPPPPSPPIESKNEPEPGPPEEPTEEPGNNVEQPGN